MWTLNVCFFMCCGEDRRRKSDSKRKTLLSNIHSFNLVSFFYEKSCTTSGHDKYLERHSSHRDLRLFDIPKDFASVFFSFHFGSCLVVFFLNKDSTWNFNLEDEEKKKTSRLMIFTYICCECFFLKSR